MTRPPVRVVPLPFARPTFTGLDPKALGEVLDSGWLTSGARVRHFEESFARYQQVREAIAVSSGTAALHLALLASGVGPGDEVITSAMTFVATCNVIVHTGATPVLVDVDSDTLNMELSGIETAVTRRTRAVIAVHFAGHPVDLDELGRLKKRWGIAIIHDAAHATEALYRGRTIASTGELCCFSFYATKNLGIGEGGMVTTADSEMAERLRALRSHGMTRDAWGRYQQQGWRHYEVREPGLNYKMTEVQGLLGLHQLPRLEENLARRAAIVERYDRALGRLPALRLLRRLGPVRSAQHLYVVRLEPGARLNRDPFLEAMTREGIGIAVHFRAIHGLDWYRNQYGWRPEDFPIAWRAGESCASLPLYPELGDSDVDDVIEAVRLVLEIKGER